MSPVFSSAQLYLKKTTAAVFLKIIVLVTDESKVLEEQS
jgi:hypothetical protein